MPRHRRFDIRLTDAEYDRFDAIARESGMTKSELFRDHIANVTVDASKRRELAAFIHALGRIGNNLNQLARFANTYKRIPPGRSLLERLAGLNRDLSALLAEARKWRS